ncbi:MAG: MCE family protein [Deltaproteobacteria bacterium]|nr:MCE family protein [Deltaproteobacteria bacterium]
MKFPRKEFLVGCLIVFVLVLMLVFGWLMGVVGPLRKEVHYSVLYGFAGGVESGSPVRVAGIKVGKVDKIEFIDRSSNPMHAVVRLTLSVSKRAAATIKEDSKFFVNMAGIIGERYIEVSPGGSEANPLADGSTVRGVDPPRIDQLLSQGYGVFGRLQELLEENQENITDFVQQLNRFLGDMNKFLKSEDRRKIVTLLDNLIAISSDVRGVTKKLSKPEAQEVFAKLYEMIQRAYEIDKPTLKKFLQEEGIRARIF